MDEEILKTIAGQLRKPHGEYAIQVGEKMNAGNLYINRYTIEALQLAANDHVLEIGMGNGFFVKDILVVDKSINYIGCDFSEIMVEEASKNNQKVINSKQAQFYLASADKLPFNNELFDKVFTVNTLYFWDNPPLILSEIRRVLKPKGQLIISIRPKSIMQHYPFVKYDFNMFTKNDLTDLLSKNSFKILATIEKEEPEPEVNGEKMRTETLIARAEKE